MKSTFTSTLLAAVLLASAAGGASAQTSGGHSPGRASDESGISFTGLVTAQGRAGKSILVDLVLLHDGQQVADDKFDTNTDGSFTISYSLDPGSYVWWIKSEVTLANSGKVDLSAGAVDINMGVLRAGDTNGNNCVDAADFSTLARAYATIPGQPGYNSSADLNGDNVINILDYSLLKGNFGKCGAPLAP